MGGDGRVVGSNEEVFLDTNAWRPLGRSMQFRYRKGISLSLGKRALVILQISQRYSEVCPSEIRGQPPASGRGVDGGAVARAIIVQIQMIRAVGHRFSLLSLAAFAAYNAAKRCQLCSPKKEEVAASQPRFVGVPRRGSLVVAAEAAELGVGRPGGLPCGFVVEGQGNGRFVATAAVAVVVATVAV